MLESCFKFFAVSTCSYVFQGKWLHGILLLKHQCYREADGFSRFHFLSAILKRAGCAHPATELGGFEHVWAYQSDISRFLQSGSLDGFKGITQAQLPQSSMGELCPSGQFALCQGLNGRDVSCWVVAHMDACVFLILMVIFQERRATFTWLILKGATGSGWLWFLPYQNPENPRQLHITALIFCWKPNLGTVSLGPWAIPCFRAFFLFQHLLQQCRFRFSQVICCNGVFPGTFVNKSKDPRNPGSEDTDSWIFLDRLLHFAEENELFDPRHRFVGEGWESWEGCAPESRFKMQRRSAQAGDVRRHAQPAPGGKNVDEVSWPTRYCTIFFDFEAEANFFLKLTMMTVGGLGGYAQNTLTERQGTGWLSKNLVRDRHTAIPACFIPPVASGLYGFDRARDLSNLFCWPWIPSHSQFMHLGGLMKPLSPAMMVYYKSTAGLMSFPTSETLLEGYHEDQTLRLTYIATDLSCLDPVHLRILSIPSHPIPSTAFCQAVDT